MRKILVASIVLTAVLSGCASSGKEITQEQVDRIVQGQTTQDQLISIFGKPMAEQYNSDGSRVLTWGYAYVGFMGLAPKPRAFGNSWSRWKGYRV